MGLLEGIEDPLGEVSDALGDFGADDAADKVDAATSWIQQRIAAAGALPVLRARFLIGPFKPGTVPIDQVDWGDALVLANEVGQTLLAKAGGAAAAAAGYAELGAAELQHDLDKWFDIEKDHEPPMHWVESVVVDEALNACWTATVVLAKPDLGAMIWERFGLAGPPAQTPESLYESIRDAFTSDTDPGGAYQWSDLGKAVADGIMAYAAPGTMADRIWNTQRPDELDLDPTRSTTDHTAVTGVPFVGKTLASDYLGAFARFSLARRFDDDQFTLNERWFSGRVTEIEDLGYDSARRARLTRVTIRPHLAQLGNRRRFRAFKNMNAVQIVKQLLEEHGIYTQEANKDATGTAVRYVPGGRELFGPLGIPDSATAAFGKLSGVDPFGVGEMVGDAVNDLLEQPLEDWRPRREYCVQYGETDLAFMERLLEEEGLTYFFEHRERLESLIICEDPRLAGKKVLTAGRMPLEASTGPSTVANAISERAWSVSIARKPVPSGVTVRDRIYTRPYESTDLKAGESLSLLSPSSLSSLTTFGGLEQMANQAMGLAGELTGAAGTEDYAGPEAQWFEWPGRLEYPVITDEPTDPFGYSSYEGPPMGQLWLEGFRAEGAIVRGNSECATIAPGTNARIRSAAFDVLHKPVQKPQRFLITRVWHFAGQATQPPPPGAPPPPPSMPNPTVAPRAFEMSYQNVFEGVNIALPYRPPRRATKPRIRGVHTAMVVDVARGEDPCTSAAEVSVIEPQSAWRVRVRMPWERSGEAFVGSETADVTAAGAAEEGSRWLRFAQPYTGAGFGWLTVPRVGMEAVIGYEEGDPDKPYVLGVLYSEAYNHAEGPRHAASVRPANDESGRIDFPARMQDAGFTSRAWPQTVRGADARGNRLRFDDSASDDEEAGHGRVEVFAQHDLAKEVGKKTMDESLGDHVTTVLHDQLNSVGTDQTELVHGDQVLLARHPSEGDSDWGREVAIVGDETIMVGGGEKREPEEDAVPPPEIDALYDEVTGNDSLEIGKSRTLHVAGDETILIGGEGANDETPGRLLDVAQGNSTVKIEGDDDFKITGSRRVKAAGSYTLRAKRIDMKTVTAGEGDGPGEGEENGGLVLDESGASMTTKGKAVVKTGAFTAESRTDRVLVKAAEQIWIHDGSGQGNSILMNAKMKTIVVRTATGADLKLGIDAAGLLMNETSIALTASPSSWTVELGNAQATSRIEGPDAKFEATDEIWLHAPQINLGETD